MLPFFLSVNFPGTGCCTLEPALHSELGVSSGRFLSLCCLSTRLGFPCVLVPAMGTCCHSQPWAGGRDRGMDRNSVPECRSCGLKRLCCSRVGWAGADRAEGWTSLSGLAGFRPAWTMLSPSEIRILVTVPPPSFLQT